MKIKTIDILRFLKSESILDFDLSSFSDVFSNSKITGSATDSREVERGNFFVAVVGETFDGHNYLEDVFNNGAIFAFVNFVPENLSAENRKKCIVVGNVKAAYQAVAKLCMRSFAGQRIALTGSAGKTTVKDWIYDILSLYGKTFATEGNRNSGYGLPWTIVKNALSDDWEKYEYGVFELGGPAGISDKRKIINPQIALVNNVYPMHLEVFPDMGLRGIAAAKAEIFSGADVAIYNADTDCADVLLDNITGDFINFGKNSEVIKLVSFDENAVNLEINGRAVSYEIGAGNTDMTVYNSMAVLSVVYVLGLPMEPAIDNMKNLFFDIGRGQKFETVFDGKKLTVFDHSYSGQPDSVLLAIDEFSKIEKRNQRKVFVFGNMSEIGPTVEQEHLRVADAVKKSDMDIVYGIKTDAKIVVDEAQKAGRIAEFYENVDEFLSVVDDKFQDGDLILIKGSHYGSSVFKIVEHLKNK